MGTIEKVIAAALTFVVLGVLFYVSCWVTIEGGKVGVVKMWGKYEEVSLEQGLHIVNPLKSVKHVSVQVVKNEEPMNLPTKSGLTVNAKAVLLYRLDPTRAPQVIRDVGVNYEETFIDPIFKNIVRDVCAEFEAEALYTDGRQKVEAIIQSRVTKELGERGIIVESCMIQDPILPQSLQDRIQAKVGAEQDVMRMQSMFKVREQEGLMNKRAMELAAETRVIEAEGISKAQKIIKQELNHEYLVFLWIKALSENHGATIYVPTGSDGMPLFKALEKK